MSITTQISEQLQADLTFYGKLFNTYIELGRKLEREQIVRALRTDFFKVLAELDAAAAEVEAFEKAELAKLLESGKEGPIKAEMAERFKALIDLVDSRHGTLVREQRNPKFKQIFENYLPILADEQ